MKNNNNPIRLATLAIALLLQLGSAASSASPVVATPGSMAGYTYFPPTTTTGGGGSSSGGEDVSTLQRCLWAPSRGDQSVTVDSSFEYDKPITLYFALAGGDGGATAMGGGGGSSAILLNGALVATGSGANGGQRAVETTGTIKIKKGDTLRFVTGGSGGAGQQGANFAIGGGGGAGYQGGGGGGSLVGRLPNAGDSPGISGKGGGNTPGAGGFVTGGLAGTSGSGMNGGISTYSDGSTAPVGPSNSTSWTMGNYWGATPILSRHPAKPDLNGSFIATVFHTGAGGGGALASSGGMGWSITRCKVQTGYTRDYFNLSSADCDSLGSSTSRYYLPKSEAYPAHGPDMRLTRVFPTVSPQQDGPTIYSFPGGALPGQIITMYQAPVCGWLN